MPFPLVTKLDSSLAVEVHLHEFYLGDRDRRCWTYLTRGRSEHGQRELALSLLIDDDGDANDVPKTPFKLFQLLSERSAGGNHVNYGDSTKLGNRGIFGFPGLFYVPAIQFQTLPNLDEYLALVLVHEEEYNYASQYGLTRFLSRLGRFCSSFPYPTWNTRARPSLFPDNIRELSMLADASHVLLEHSHVHQLGDILQLQLHQSDADKALHAMDNLDDDQVAILNTAFSPRCNASLYWQEGQDGPGAYAAPEADTGMIGGSFLSLCHSDECDVSIIEDGYSINLRSTQWHQLRKAIEHSRAAEFDLGDSQRFVVDFVDVAARPRARPYQAVAVWRHIDTTEFSAELPAEEPAGKPAATAEVTMGAFINLTGEKSLTQRVDQAALQDYFRRIHATLSEALSAERDSLEFDLELTVYPERIESRLIAHEELNPDFINFIDVTVHGIRTCPVTSQIRVRLPFHINGALR